MCETWEFWKIILTFGTQKKNINISLFKIHWLVKGEMEWISFFFVLNDVAKCFFFINLYSLTLTFMKSKSLMWIQHLWCIHFANLKKSCSLLADEPSSVSDDLSHVRDGTKMIPWKNVQSRKTFIRSQNLISVCEEFCNLASLLKSSAMDFFSEPRVLRAQVAWNYRCEQRKSVNNPLSKVAVWLRSVPPLGRSPLRK